MKIKKGFVVFLTVILLSVSFTTTAFAYDSSMLTEWGNFPLTYRGHSNGNYTKLIQYFLNWCPDIADAHPTEWNAGELNVDGQFGAITEKWVKWYQTLHGLTADGKVGRQTWTRMARDMGGPFNYYGDGYGYCYEVGYGECPFIARVNLSTRVWQVNNFDNQDFYLTLP